MREQDPDVATLHPGYGLLPTIENLDQFCAAPGWMTTFSSFST
jgi:hypothetical protein